MHAQEMHAHEMHAREYARKVHAYEMHAREMYNMPELFGCPSRAGTSYGRVPLTGGCLLRAGASYRRVFTGRHRGHLIDVRTLLPESLSSAPYRKLPKGGWQN